MINDTTRSSLGKMRISDEAIATISSIAASKISGVIGLRGSFVDSIAEMLGRKSADKGVKVLMTERDVIIDLSLVVEFGVDIPDVTWQVQESVRDAVESMTGLNVREVNININQVAVRKNESEK